MSLLYINFDLCVLLKRTCQLIYRMYNCDLCMYFLIKIVCENGALVLYQGLNLNKIKQTIH